MIYVSVQIVKKNCYWAS